jgi:predicted MPP superfamily phosphohydrolase
MDAFVDPNLFVEPEADDIVTWLEARLGVDLATRRLAREAGIDITQPGVRRWRRLVARERIIAMVPKLLRWGAALARGRRNASCIEIVRHDVVIPHLPSAFDGYVILHLTDLHADISEGAMSALPATIAGLEYDACVFTGDFRGLAYGPHGRAAELVADVVSTIPVPIYGVLGNHDPVALLPSLEHAGIRMLMNERVRINRGSGHLWLAGVDDPHHYRTDDVDLATAGIASEDTVIMLSHSADNYERAAVAGVNLFLCGHTHGGQICLPGRWPVVTSTNLPRRLVAGPWRHGGMFGYTSRGVGTCVLDVRFNCPPEVTLHTLRRASHAGLPGGR